MINRSSSKFTPTAAALVAVFATFTFSCSHPPAPPAPYHAFVVCKDTSSVAVVNLREARVVASLEVSARPEAAVVRPGGREVFVTGPGGLDRIELPDLKVHLNSRTDHHPRSLVFSPDGRLAYYLMELAPLPPAGEEPPQGPPRLGVSHISVYDCDAQREVGQIGVAASLSRLAITADGKTLVATDPVAGKVHIFDSATREPLGVVEAGRGAGPVLVQPFGSKAFVSNTQEEKISVVDTAARQILSHIELGARPGMLLLKPDGGELFVLCPQASTLAIVDAFHDNVTQTLPTGREPAAGVFRRDSSVLYLANAGDGSVTTLDVQNRTVLASTHVGVEAHALALTPDERFVVAADAGASSLAILIAEPERLAQVGSALLSTVPVGARPVDVVVPDWLGEP